jgi:hypothetical protein
MTPTAARRARPSPSPRWLPLTLLLLLTMLVASPAVAQDGPVGVLVVSANIKGAEVWVDGEQVGTVPYTGYLPVGRHQVRVVADNHDPFVRRVDLREALTSSLEAILEPGVGTVEFKVEPAGAVVHIDGKPVGPSPIRIQDVAPGHHSYLVQAEGFEPAEAEFDFAKGKNLFFSLELLNSAGLFQVDSEPAGATVWLDGEQVGVTPLDLTDVPLGEHQVRVALDGYAEVFRPVDTTDGRKGALDLVLTERGSRLTVKTGADGASVLVNGSLAGQGARVVLPAVDRGTLLLAVSASGLEPATMSVRMPARGRVTVKADLQPAGAGRSELVQLPPLYGRWTFWAASAAVVGGGVTGAVILAKALEPPAPPEGDVLVVLP